MASPQKENGNTGISNELLEKLLLFDFTSASPIKIWLFIARKTYGFQKKLDYLSLSQIQNGTNLSRQTVNDSLMWLVKACLLVKGESSQKGTVYGVNKDYEQWVVNTHRLVKRNHLGSLPAQTHNKKYNKNNIALKNAKYKNMYKEPIIEIDSLGETITRQNVPEKFGKTTASIAIHYCKLTGKTSPKASLVAAKELCQIAKQEFPDETLLDWEKEIKGRIEVAKRYYDLKGIKDWGLRKVGENWNKILTEWKLEVNKHQ
jgi:phage replication O-like protein O